MNRPLALALAAALTAALAFGTPSPGPAATSPDILGDAPSCEEDMPCWDCSTMGNRICGPTSTLGQP